MNRTIIAAAWWESPGPEEWNNHALVTSFARLQCMPVTNPLVIKNVRISIWARVRRLEWHRSYMIMQYFTMQLWPNRQLARKLPISSIPARERSIECDMFQGNSPEFNRRVFHGVKKFTISSQCCQ